MRKISRIVALMLCLAMLAVPVMAAVAPTNTKDFGTMYETQKVKFKSTFEARFLENEAGEKYADSFVGTANVLPADMLILEGESYVFPLKDGKWSGVLHSNVKAKFKSNHKALKIGKMRQTDDGLYEVPFTITGKKLNRSGENDLTVTATYKKNGKVTDTIDFIDYGEMRGELGYLYTTDTTEATCETAGKTITTYYFKFDGDDNTMIQTIDREAGTATLLGTDETGNHIVIPLQDRFAFTKEEAIAAFGHDYQPKYVVDAEGTITHTMVCTKDATHVMKDAKGEVIVETDAVKPTAVEKPEYMAEPEAVEAPVIPEGLTVDEDGNVIVPTEPAGRPETVVEPVAVANPGEAPVAVDNPGDEPDESEVEAHATWVTAKEAYDAYVTAKEAYDTNKANYDNYVTAKTAYDNFVAATTAYEESEDYLAYLEAKTLYEEQYLPQATAYNNYLTAQAEYVQYLNNVAAYNAYVDDVAGYDMEVIKKNGKKKTVHVEGYDEAVERTKTGEKIGLTADDKIDITVVPTPDPEPDPDPAPGPDPEP